MIDDPVRDAGGVDISADLGTFVHLLVLDGRRVSTQIDTEYARLCLASQPY